LVSAERRAANAGEALRLILKYGGVTDYSEPFAVQVCSLQAVRSLFAGP
jgi:hypothetical protein